MTDDTRDVETTETAEAVEDVPGAAETEVDAPKRTERGRHGWSRALRKVKVVPVILVLLLLTSGGVATWLYFERYQPNQQTDPSVARAVVSAASDGTVALLSYSPESLDKDFATAKSHLPGISCRTTTSSLSRSWLRRPKRSR